MNMKDDFDLEHWPKDNVYKVPDGYFEKLPITIMQRCTSPREKAMVQWFRLALSFQLVALATLVAGVLLTGGVLLNTPFGQAPVVSSVFMADIPSEEIMQYLLASEQVDPADMVDLAIADADLWQGIENEEYIEEEYIELEE